MKNKASLIPFIVLGLVTVLGCGRLAQRVAEQAGTDEPEPSRQVSSGGFTLEGKEWKSFELDGMDIKVDLPGEPSDKTPSASQLPPGWDRVFSSMRIHSYDEKDFASSYSQLVPTGKRSFTIKELADTSMASLKKQARDLTYKLDVQSPSNARYDGTFTRNGKMFELKGCCVYQKSPARVWAVITVYPKDSTDGRTASERILESTVFSGSAEECK